MEKYLKYFFFFLILAIVIVSVYFFIKSYKTPPKQIQEGFQGAGTFLVSLSGTPQQYFPEIQLFVDNRATWGTITTVQTTAKNNAISFFNKFADLAWNKG
jgi:hypothetical protein